MSKIHAVTLPRLNRALGRVNDELHAQGLWNEKLERIDVYLVPFGFAYGWQWYGSTGDIGIPAISLAKLRDWLSGSYFSLADVLRHEYAHALADTHRGLIRSRRFTRAFKASHENLQPFVYDPELHVSPYAATCAAEDFAEVFMLYLRHGACLPGRLDTPAIRRKWRFVKALCGAIKRVRTRW